MAFFCIIWCHKESRQIKQKWKHLDLLYMFVELVYKKIAAAAQPFPNLFFFCPIPMKPWKRFRVHCLVKIISLLTILVKSNQPNYQMCV